MQKAALDHGAALVNPEREVSAILDFTEGTVTREGVNAVRIRADFERFAGRLDACA